MSTILAFILFTCFIWLTLGWILCHIVECAVVGADKLAGDWAIGWVFVFVIWFLLFMGVKLS